MADKIITFEYAANNLAAYQLQPIPNNKKCMTKSQVQAYINCDPNPLSGYVNNRLVPISKVIGMVIGLPSDITYSIKTSNSTNSIGKSGVEERSILATSSSNGDYFSPLNVGVGTGKFHYNPLIVRTSASDPSFNKTIPLPDYKQPLNYIINDIYEFLGLSSNTYTTFKRGGLLMDGQPGDWSNRIMLDDFSGTLMTPSQFWIDGATTNGASLNEPKDFGMGGMFLPSSQDQSMNPLNLVGNYNMLDSSTYPNAPGYTDTGSNYRRIIQSSQTNGFWDVIYILSQFRVICNLKHPSGIQNFTVEYF